MGIFAPSAYAYFDPGSGSIIFQALIAGAMVGLFLLRRSWTKIVDFVKQLSGKADKGNGSE